MYLFPSLSYSSRWKCSHVVWLFNEIKSHTPWLQKMTDKLWKRWMEFCSVTPLPQKCEKEKAECAPQGFACFSIVCWLHLMISCLVMIAVSCTCTHSPETAFWLFLLYRLFLKSAQNKMKWISWWRRWLWGVPYCSCTRPALHTLYQPLDHIVYSAIYSLHPSDKKSAYVVT